MGILRESGTGKVSLLRIAVVVAVVLATAIITSGVIGWFLGKADAAAIIGLGVGLFSVSEIGKAIQKGAEAKEV